MIHQSDANRIDFHTYPEENDVTCSQLQVHGREPPIRESSTDFTVKKRGRFTTSNSCCVLLVYAEEVDPRGEVCDFSSNHLGLINVAQ